MWRQSPCRGCVSALRHPHGMLRSELLVDSSTSQGGRHVVFGALRVIDLDAWWALEVPLESVEDARRCVRYLRERADDLGLDRDKIVLAGASSGGHTAAMAVLGADEPLGLAGLLLFNPVLDLQFKECWRERRWCAPAWRQNQRPWRGTWLASGAFRMRFGEKTLLEESPLFRARRASPNKGPRTR